MKTILFIAALSAATPALAQYSQFQSDMDMMQLDMGAMADDMDALTDAEMQRHPERFQYRHAPREQRTCFFRMVLPFMPCFP
jgi:hypothetical protein